MENAYVVQLRNAKEDLRQDIYHEQRIQDLSLITLNLEGVTVGKMRSMGANGDTVTTWDPEVKESVEKAKAEFEMLEKMHRIPFNTTNPESGEFMEKFDPKAEEIIFIPQFSGG